MLSCGSSGEAWLSSAALASPTAKHLIQRTTRAFKLSNFPLRRRALDLCRSHKTGAQSTQCEEFQKSEFGSSKIPIGQNSNVSKGASECEFWYVRLSGMIWMNCTSLPEILSIFTKSRADCDFPRVVDHPTPRKIDNQEFTGLP